MCPHVIYCIVDLDLQPDVRYTARCPLYPGVGEGPGALDLFSDNRVGRWAVSYNPISMFFSQQTHVHDDVKWT